MAQMIRIRRPRSEYEALLARKHNEGQTYKQLAVESGIPESTLTRWAGRLRRERAEPSSAFVELRTAAAEGGVELILQNGVRIGLRRGFDAQLLKDVVDVLGC